MRPTMGRLRSLRALAEPNACALPDGRASNGYTITSEIRAMLLRHDLIDTHQLSNSARAKHGIWHVYRITELGRTYIAEHSEADCIERFQRRPRLQSIAQ